MSKLIQKIKWGVDNTKIDMYMYGEADFEANKAMQEPLEKLYKYENQPDVKEKVKEYIDELEMEIKRLEDELIIKDSYVTKNHMCRIATFQEVINDFNTIIDEVHNAYMNNADKSEKRN